MRHIDRVVIHHSDSEWGNAINIEEWHKAKPHEFDMIGYHYIITNGHTDNHISYDHIADGLIETGRPIELQGAHCLGYNETSIGVCLIGRSGRFSSSQYKALANLLKQLRGFYGDIEINMHSDLDEKKGKCPGISVTDLLEEMIRVKEI